MQLGWQGDEGYLSPLVRFADGRSHWEVNLLCLLLTVALGIIHYLLGPTVPLSLAYAIPVVIAAWFSGATSGAIFSVLCVAIWFLGSYPTGHVVPVVQSPIYGAIIRLTEYAIYTAVFVHLSHLQRNLKDLAERRALALSQESALRASLEHEMLEISEREQDRIGRDLHDSLCQHLTGTALAGHLLAKSLGRDGLPQAQNARKIVDLIEEGISLARSIAKGLHPLESRSDGLMIGLEEFTAATSELLFQPLKTPIEVINAIDNGLALGGQRRDHERDRRAQVGGHDRRAGETLDAFDGRAFAVELDARAEPRQLLDMHEAVLEDRLRDVRGAARARHQRHQLRL